MGAPQSANNSQRVKQQKTEDFWEFIKKMALLEEKFKSYNKKGMYLVFWFFFLYSPNHPERGSMFVWLICF